MHDILGQGTGQANPASKYLPFHYRLLICPKLQDGGHQGPCLSASAAHITAGLTLAVRLCRDLPDCLSGARELVEKVVRECRYWIVEPEFHIPPAPIYNGYNLQGETFAIPPKVPEGVNLLHVALWIQPAHSPSYPVIWLVFHLSFLRVTRKFSWGKPEVLLSFLSSCVWGAPCDASAVVRCLVE